MKSQTLIKKKTATRDKEFELLQKNIRQLKAKIEHLEEENRHGTAQIADYKYALDESAIVAITDQKGIIKHANKNFCKISKYRQEELIGKDHRIINSGLHSKMFIKNLWTTIASGKIWRGELRNKAKDGTFYWVDTTIIPFLNDKGKPYQYVAIRADITARKKAEEELQKLNEQLEQKIEDRTMMLRETLAQLENSKEELATALEKEKELSDLKSRFVSTVSHEFRTPLSTVLSSASLLSKYTKTDEQEKRERHIERIKESVKHLNLLLEDLLSLGKLDEGLIAVKNETFDLLLFLKDFINEMQEIVRKNQRIVLSFESCGEFTTDRRLLKNILLNLVSNAIKFSPEESAVFVTASCKKNELKISVKDSGIGISKEDKEHLFERFFRARNAANIQGTGLGLHIVSKYLELLNGTISLESELGEGTTFLITIPKA